MSIYSKESGLQKVRESWTQIIIRDRLGGRPAAGGHLVSKARMRVGRFPSVAFSAEKNVISA